MARFRINPNIIVPERRQINGFTLIELLVVLAILGLLALVVTPQVFKYLAGAKIDAAKLQVQGLSAALEYYRYDVGRLPTTDEGLKALVSAPADAPHWKGPYVKKQDSLIDPWGHPYVYRYPGEHSEFDLSSLGPEQRAGKDDGASSITNW